MRDKAPLTCAAAIVLACCMACALPARSVDSAFSGSSVPLVFEPPSPERIQLDNGMIVYLLEDHELPLVTASALIRTGSVYEPAPLAGLAGLTGTVMRTGGASGLSSDEVDRRLEDMSASVTVAIGPEQGTATLSALREDIRSAFSLYARILRSPAFESEKIEIARNTACQGLRQVPDNPQGLAFREFKKLLYSGNPRSVQPTLGSMRRIRRQDLVEFHGRFFRPENIMLAVSGDFSRDEMLGHIREQFGSWPRSDRPAQPVPGPSSSEDLRSFVLKKPIPQSTIVMGQLAPRKSEPDAFAFQVADFIIGGGGFTSRLFSEVRSRHGLAYSVGSFYRGDVDYGVFGAYCMTKAGSTNQALVLMAEILRKIKKGEISDQEFAWAKESILNNFIFSFTSSAQIVSQQMQLEYDRLPSDYLRTAPEKIRALTKADVQRVSEKWLRPDKLLIVTVGDDRHFDIRPDDWQWGRPQAITSDILSE